MSNFEHAGKFHLNNALATAISDIVTQQENKNKEETTQYSCFIIESPIHKRKTSYVAIMDTTAKTYFDKINFINSKHLTTTLESLSLFSADYNGILNVNSSDMFEKLPYLQPFFNELDKTRELSGRVSVYPDEVSEAYDKTLAQLDLSTDAYCME